MPSEFRCMVFAYLDGEVRAVPAGQLLMQEESTEVLSSLFGYGATYLQRPNAIPIDPASLPLDVAVPGSQREVEPINGLASFGAVRDAMPDRWGRRVIENKLRVPANALPESAYLKHAGSNRLGALDFRTDPTSEEQDGLLTPASALQYLLDAADRVQRNEPVPEHLSQLFAAGSSMGGARPKAVVIHDGIQYLAKFPALGDAFNVPLIERSTLELARACGLKVPKTNIIKLPDARVAMLIERFDREPVKSGWARRPVASALTILALHESESAGASYSDISLKMAALGARGQVKADRVELFGRMVFNILVSNDDDHLRNHAFIWRPALRGWVLSPLYDVLPRPQMAPVRYLHLGVGRQGRLATLPNALSGAPMFGLLEPEARDIIDGIATTVRGWRNLFEDIGVPATECDLVAAAFRRPRDVGWP